RERLRVVGRRRGWGAFVRNCTTPHPARRLPAPRHPPHRHSASKTRVNALEAGGGVGPPTPSLLPSKMCACPIAEAGAPSPPPPRFSPAGAPCTDTAHGAPLSRGRQQERLR